MIEVISYVRYEKSKAQKSMKAEIVLAIPKEDQKILKDILADIKAVASAKEIKEGSLNVVFL